MKRSNRNIRTKQIYLSAAYERRPEMIGHRDVLRNAGFEVKARWLDGAQHNWDRMSAALKEDYSQIDLEDAQTADIVITFTGGGPRGGRHVEFGVGLATGARVILVGHRENIFHWHPDVEVYDSLDDVIRKALI